MQVVRVLGLPGDGAKREDVTPFSDQTTLAARDRIGLLPDHLSLLCSFRIAAIRPPPV